MKLKLDASGNVVVVDGKPVYVHDDGKEIAFDAPAAMTKIGELNEENKTHRLRANDLAEKMKVYVVKMEDGKPIFLDAEAAKKAMETVQNLDDKKLLDAKGVEKLKLDMGAAYIEKEKELTKGFTMKIDDLSKTIGAKDQTIYNLTVRQMFATSPTITKKTILPPDMAAEYFGKHFRVEEGDKGAVKVVAYIDGEKVLSREKPGDPAEFEEAIGLIIDRYPMKDQILKAAQSGSGAQGGRATTGLKDEEKKAFASLPATERLRRIHERGSAGGAGG